MTHNVTATSAAEAEKAITATRTDGHTERVRVFDTTLRDGEQAPGINLDAATKVAIAAHLERLAVDVIEAGFPASSPGDFKAVSRVAEAARGATVAALARILPEDIDRAAQALRPALKPRLHTFIATSPIHLKNKLFMTEREVIEAIAAGVSRARSHVADVEFSAEDATRTDPAFLKEAYETAIRNGARTCNVADTVGYCLPEQFGELVAWLIHEVPGGQEVVWSVHCHNDLGLATANALAGIRAGARQAEVTVNGIGERAGNCSLEELVLALRTHAGSIGLDTGVDTTHIGQASELTATSTGYPVPANKAIVGRNAFAHESGIHQHGVLLARETYEHIDAATLGLRGGQLVLGKHSGRHGFTAALAQLGVELSDAELRAAYAEFKAVADQRSPLTSDELRELAGKYRAGRETAAHALR
jgi:2-isopropylmalate synthase